MKKSLIGNKNYDDEEDELDNSARKKRFQSAFKVPNSNRHHHHQQPHQEDHDVDFEGDFEIHDQGGMMYQSDEEESEEEFLKPYWKCYECQIENYLLFIEIHTHENLIILYYIYYFGIRITWKAIE